MSKYYYDNSDVAHSWIHQRDSSAHSAGSRCNFSGKEIFSYSTMMGKIYENKKGSKLVLLNEDRYSATTSKHQYVIKAAIPSYMNVVNVGRSVDVRGILDHKDNIEHILGKIEKLSLLQLKARKRDYLGEIEEAAEELRTYLNFFPIKTKVYSKLDSKKLFKAVTEDSTEWWENVKNTAKGAEEDREKQRLAVQRKKEKANKKKITEWLSGMHGKSDIMHIMGDKVYLRLLSVKDYEQSGLKSVVVQTSKGIEVSAESAMKLYDAVVRVATSVVSEEAIDKFMEKQGVKEIDSWTIDRVTKDGDIIAGCHRIPFSEVQRFAKAYGWENRAK